MSGNTAPRLNALLLIYIFSGINEAKNYRNLLDGSLFQELYCDTKTKNRLKRLLWVFCLIMILTFIIYICGNQIQSAVPRPV